MQIEINTKKFYWSRIGRNR